MSAAAAAAADRLRADRLLDEAVATAGVGDDLGEPTWQEGLERLLDALRTEAQLNDIGVEVAAGDVVGHLANRLRITAWRAAHPTVADLPVVRPIVIVGQPRTGTTILYDLLALDPELRAPLTWEIDRPVPPPDPATRDTDPRIAEVDAVLAMVDAVVPGFTDFHPLGARLAQECVRITAGDFRSMIFGTQYRTPSYDRWLVDEADMAPAYRWHRCYLQHLGSGDAERPAPQWLLKSPAHLWHLDALAAEYPDAVIVQTHRDPLKVIASVSALAAHLRRMASDAPDIVDVAAHWSDLIFEGLDRGMAARERQVFPPAQFVDVHFQDFVGDPLATVERLYAALGRELIGATADRMRAFLAEHPGDGGGAGTRYRWADTALDAGSLRERAAPYQDRFGVASEPVR